MFWTKRVDALGWDILLGAEVKQFKKAGLILGCLGEEQKVGKGRGLGDLGEAQEWENRKVRKLKGLFICK